MVSYDPGSIPYMRSYNRLPNDRKLARKGGQRTALWAGAQPYGAHTTMPEGARAQGSGDSARISYKVGFYAKIWVLIMIKPIFNDFSPFLGDIGHFWSLIFGRKLEMSNQLPSYITQAFLRP
jgi:hypothetical protein